MSDKVGDLRLVMSGTAIVEGHESLYVEDGKGTSLTLRWVRDDDNTLTHGTMNALAADLPRAKPSVDVVHSFRIARGDDGHTIEARFYVNWIYDWSRVVSYTVLANF
jgi:hypothetical protein